MSAIKFLNDFYARMDSLAERLRFFPAESVRSFLEARRAKKEHDLYKKFHSPSTHSKQTPQMMDPSTAELMARVRGMMYVKSQSFFLSFILLPLTLITFTLALLIDVIAFLSKIITYPMAGILDCFMCSWVTPFDAATVTSDTGTQPEIPKSTSDVDDQIDIPKCVSDIDEQKNERLIKPLSRINSLDELDRVPVSSDMKFVISLLRQENPCCHTLRDHARMFQFDLEYFKLTPEEREMKEMLVAYIKCKLQELQQVQPRLIFFSDLGFFKQTEPQTEPQTESKEACDSSVLGCKPSS